MLLPTYGGEKPDGSILSFFFPPIRVLENIKMVSDIISHFMIVRWSTCVHEYLAQCLQTASVVVTQPTGMK